MKKNREKVAEILRAVRIGRMHVKDALLEFPDVTDDKSIMASYHALVHYEADEDLRNRDVLYKEEQDDYLEFIAYTLSTGEDLPKNIIDNYKNFYENVPILHEQNIKGFFKGFWKNLNIKGD